MDLRATVGDEEWHRRYDDWISSLSPRDILLQKGEHYELGLEGKEQNVRKAISFYEKAAQQHSSVAYLRLAHIYQNGNELDEVIVNERKAIALFEKAGAMGCFQPMPR